MARAAAAAEVAAAWRRGRQRSYNTKTDCENAGRTWTADNHNTWNGCITDRDQNFDTLNSAPSLTDLGVRLFPAEQYSYCPGR